MRCDSFLFVIEKDNATGRVAADGDRWERASTTDAQLDENVIMHACPVRTARTGKYGRFILKWLRSRLAMERKAQFQKVAARIDEIQKTCHSFPCPLFAVPPTIGEKRKNSAASTATSGKIMLYIHGNMHVAEPAQNGLGIKNE